MKKQLLLIAAAGLFMSVLAQPSKPKRAYVEFLVTTNNHDRLYHLGEEASVTVEAYKGGLPLNDVYVRYSYGEEMMPSAKNDSVKFNNGKAVIPIGSMTLPGFKACKLDFSVDGKTYRDMVKVGFDPQQIASFSPNPSDFDSFWKKTLKATAKINLNPEITPLPQYSTDKVEVSLVKLTVGPHGRNIYGYLSRPKDGKKHPVLFCPPGAGSRKIEPTTFYSERGYIFFNINIHNGCNSELSDSAYAKARRVANDYVHNGIESKEKFYYKDVYAGCSRCIDFLCTLPDWDGVNVGVTGGSQGGALTIVTAALNSKVTFCAPFYPALCDLLGFKEGRAGGWPKYFKGENEKQGAGQTLPYYDVVNFARRLKCPTYYSFGYNDDTCSPTSTYAAYNAITAPKHLTVTPTSGHWRFNETNEESIDWMNQQLKHE